MTGWYLDACALINLYASGQLPDLARQQGRPFLLVPTVVQEAGWVFERRGEERGERVPIDLGPLEREGLIEVVLPDAAVQARFLQLVTELDDGEAMTIAAANMSGDAGVVTDDQAAIRYLNALAGPAVTTSLALLRAHLSAFPLSEGREVLLNVRICGRYVPGPSHPEITWWREVLAGG
ncbi:MAG: hypothetical protein ACR2J4_05240 [Deinococcus sp.]